MDEVRDIVDLLSPVDGMPNIETRRDETTTRKWAKEGMLQKSIPIYRDSSDKDWYDHDYKVVLMPFCRLRNVRKATIRSPEGFHSRNFCVRKYRVCHGTKGSFGTLKPCHLWDDDSIQEDLELTQFLFNDALDHLPGCKADFMRVDRFSRWYDQDSTIGKPHYLKYWARIHSEEQ